MTVDRALATEIHHVQETRIRVITVMTIMGACVALTAFLVQQTNFATRVPVNAAVAQHAKSQLTNAIARPQPVCVTAALPAQEMMSTDVMTPPGVLVELPHPAASTAIFVLVPMEIPVRFVSATVQVAFAQEQQIRVTLALPRYANAARWNLAMRITRTDALQMSANAAPRTLVTLPQILPLPSATQTCVPVG